jgi:hypothetical protein
MTEVFNGSYKREFFIVITGDQLHFIDSKKFQKSFIKKAPRPEEDEAPVFPTNSRVVATWFPQQERAFATGVCIRLVSI